MRDDDDRDGAFYYQKLLYRAQHRGTAEMDFLLGRFAYERLKYLDKALLKAFEELLSVPDPELEGLILGGGERQGVDNAAPQTIEIINEIKKFHAI